MTTRALVRRRLSAGLAAAAIIGLGASTVSSASAQMVPQAKASTVAGFSDPSGTESASEPARAAKAAKKLPTKSSCTTAMKNGAKSCTWTTYRIKKVPGLKSQRVVQYTDWYMPRKGREFIARMCVRGDKLKAGVWFTRDDVFDQVSAREYVNDHLPSPSKVPTIEKEPWPGTDYACWFPAHVSFKTGDEIGSWSGLRTKATHVVDHKRVHYAVKVTGHDTDPATERLVF